MPRLGYGDTSDLPEPPRNPIDLDNRQVLQVTAGSGHTCALLNDDSIRCWGGNSNGELGIGSSVSVSVNEGQMGSALVAADVFVVTPGAGLEGVRLEGMEGDQLGQLQGQVHLQYNGSFGQVCDDQWNDAAAQVTCRDLGMAGGRAVVLGVTGAADIVADNVVCQGTEVSLRDCRFRGWKLHDCSPQEAAGGVQFGSPC